MKDVTKVVLQQSKEYGRRANENITRIDIYKSKMKNIYRLLGKKKLLIKICVGKEQIGFRIANIYEAKELLDVFGERYFLDIQYKNSRDAVLIKITGMAPEKPGEGITM